MKKLFVSILALAAFAACQSDLDNDLNVNVPQQGGANVGGSHTIYAEVGIGGETKATYGDDLKATWEENDQIALLQEHADYNKPFSVVNKLTIKSGWGTNSAAFNGDISVDATSPRVYHIAYPTSAVSFNTSLSLTKGESTYTTQDSGSILGSTMAYYAAAATYNYKYVANLNITVPTEQNGMWEPYMYASTSESVSSNGIGAKELTTLTGAIAIRAFEPDGVTPKQLKQITITSSDAAIAGAFTGSSESSASLHIQGAYTSDDYSTVRDEDTGSTMPGRTKGKAEADKLLQSAAQATEPTSTSVTKVMALSFAGNERVITLTNLENIPMDSEGYYTYYVNVAPATVGTLEIAALDINGGELEREVYDVTFAASHRKGYKLTWEDASLVPGTIETWYDSWNVSSFELAGNTIYARNIGVNGVPADHVLALGIEINGQLHEASAQSGVLSAEEIKIEGYPSGTYSICTYAKIMLNGQETVLKSDAKTITVTSIPTATYNVYTSYSNNGSKALRNDVYGNEYRARVDISDAYIQTNFVKSTTLTYGGSTANLTPGSEWKTTLGYGSYSSSIKVVLKNGYTLTSPTYATYVTGIPYTMNVTANDGTWSESGNVAWNNTSRGTALRLGSAVGSSMNTGASSVTKTFYLPANTNVVVKGESEAQGSRFISNIETTYNCYISGTSAGSASAKGNNNYSSVTINKTMTMTSSNPVMQHHNSNSTNTACSYVKSCSVTYAL